MTLRTAWAFPTSARMGYYAKGMGAAGSDPREQVGCLQVKRLLAHYGYAVDITTNTIGVAADKAIRQYQTDHGLVSDGAAGVNTLRSMLTPLYRQVCSTRNIDDGGKDWGGCQMGWEGVLDPAATYVNKDGSLDRGLYQFNDKRTPVTDDQAYDPLYIISYRMTQAWTFRSTILAACEANGLDSWKIAISANRAPTGAIYWAGHPEVQPVDHRGEPTATLTPKEWAEFCAFYMTRVDSGGRATWTGKAAA